MFMLMVMFKPEGAAGLGADLRRRLIGVQARGPNRVLKKSIHSTF
jgi:hypothetical protein